jgi:ATP-binding cassette subfamily F protein 3
MQDALDKKIEEFI